MKIVSLASSKASEYFTRNMHIILQVSIVLMTVVLVSALPEPEAKPEAKPGLIAPIAYSAPVIAAAPIVTATSHQSFVRNYGFAAPLVDARVPLAYTAFSPYVASPYAYSSYAPVAPLKYTAAPILV